MMVQRKFKSYRIGILFLLAVNLLGGCSTSPYSEEGISHSDSALVEESHLKASSSQIKNGGLLVLTLNVSKRRDVNSIRSEFDGKVIRFFRLPDEESSRAQTFQALVGIHHSAKLGNRSIAVSWVEDGERRVKKINFEVISGKYRRERLRVDPSKARPGKKHLARIRREGRLVRQVYSQSSANKYWDGPFALPVRSKVTSPYGTHRVFNGKTRSYHSGLDLRAPVGTRIRAAANGKVVLAKNLFYTGNTVILDHGFGLFSVYAHLSRTLVKHGQVLKKNQVLGRSGQTGRVNGPHLHWGITVNFVKVNPLDLTNTSLQ